MHTLRTIFASLSAAAAVWVCAPAAQAVSYADWVASYGLTGDAAAIDADPDGDGMGNLIEYALDTGSPVVPSPLDALPEYGRVRRTGEALGEWEWVPGTGTHGRRFAGDASGGVGDVWHAAIRWRARPGVEGIRYRPELSSDMARWYSGRSAVVNEMVVGTQVQSVAIMQGQDFRRYFLRLRVEFDAEAGDGLAGIRAVGIATQSLDVGVPMAAPRVLVAATAESVVVEDRQLVRSTGATTIRDFTWAWSPAPNNIEPAEVVRESSAPAVIVPTPGNPYHWTAVAEGSAVLTLRTGSASYTAEVSVVELAGQANDRVVGYVPGSLRRALIDTVDGAIAGTTPGASLRLYTVQDHAGGIYVRNADAWPARAGYVQALTAISPWNSNSGPNKAGVAISARHILFAAHYQIAVGAAVRFVEADGTVHTRTITGRTTLPGYTSTDLYPDLTVAVLDSDLPAGITPVCVPPDDLLDYLPELTSGGLIPSIGLDQEEKALISDWSLHSLSGKLVEGFRRPESVERGAYYEDKISGDSGNPAGLLVDGQLMLLTVWTGGGGGAGTSVLAHKAAIQTAMDGLAAGYTLTEANLSAYPTY